MAKTISLLKDLDGSDVKTPQIVAMVNVLKNTVGLNVPVVATEFYAAVDADTENFKSVQGAARVWKFYEKRLIEGGYIGVEGVDVKEPKAKKVAADGTAVTPKRSASKRAKGAETSAPAANDVDAGTDTAAA